MDENDKPVSTISCFDKDNTEVLRIEQNGDVIWKGREIESDAEFKAAMIDLVNVLKGHMQPAPAEVVRGLVEALKLFAKLDLTAPIDAIIHKDFFWDVIRARAALESAKEHGL